MSEPMAVGVVFRDGKPLMDQRFIDGLSERGVQRVNSLLEPHGYRIEGKKLVEKK